MDHPFEEVYQTALNLYNRGIDFYQKFTCANCEARQTMEQPNIMYKTGQCEECDHVTDIEEEGCNLTVIFSTKNEKI